MCISEGKIMREIITAHEFLTKIPESDTVLTVSDILEDEHPIDCECIKCSERIFGFPAEDVIFRSKKEIADSKKSDKLKKILSDSIKADEEAVESLMIKKSKFDLFGKLTKLVPENVLSVITASGIGLLTLSLIIRTLLGSFSEVISHGIAIIVLSYVNSKIMPN